MEKTESSLQDVSDNQLGLAGAAELGAMLKVNEELRVLKAAGNKFQEKDAIFIAESLQVQSTLYHSSHGNPHSAR